jgi:hypothetical protein
MLPKIKFYYFIYENHHNLLQNIFFIILEINFNLLFFNDINYMNVDFDFSLMNLTVDILKPIQKDYLHQYLCLKHYFFLDYH